ncbi:MAG: carbohydrate ABC transporter permease [Phycisphaerales bacterium]
MTSAGARVVSGGGRPAWLKVVLYGSAAALLVLAIGPALWLVRIALQKPGADVGALDLTGGYTLDNFAGAWSEGGLAVPLINSAITTALRAGLNVVLASLAAYPLARMSFRGRTTVFTLILATMMIPEQVIIVPMFRTVVGLGLADTLAALIIPFAVSAFGVFMCRQALLQIPWSLEESARIDGAGSLRIWWHVMLPLIAPTLATLGIFSVIGSWSDLLWPLLVLSSREKYTLPVAVNELLGVFSTNQRYAYAGSVLALLPIVAAFLIAQRWFKPGAFAGAVKG